MIGTIRLCDVCSGCVSACDVTGPLQTCCKETQTLNNCACKPCTAPGLNVPAQLLWASAGGSPVSGTTKPVWRSLIAQ